VEVSAASNKPVHNNFALLLIKCENQAPWRADLSLLVEYTLPPYLKWTNTECHLGACSKYKMSQAPVADTYNPIILVTQEAEVRRITIQSQLRQIVHETLS
jgi:hypothetical protein